MSRVVGAHLVANAQYALYELGLVRTRDPDQLRAVLPPSELRLPLAFHGKAANVVLHAGAGSRRQPSAHRLAACQPGFPDDEFEKITASPST